MIVYLYLICGIIIGCLFTWMFLQRKGVVPEITMSSGDGVAFRDNVSKLITEFNKISNANINTLEDKIRDIKEVVEMADERIVRINSSLSDMGIVSRRIQEPLMPLREIQRRKEAKSVGYGAADTETRGVQLSEMLPLTEDKTMSTVDISLPAALPLSGVILTEDEDVTPLSFVPQQEILKKTLLPLREIPSRKSTKEHRTKSMEREVTDTNAQNVQLPGVLSPPEVLPPPEILPLIPVSSKKKAKKEKEKENEKPVLTPLPRTATKEEKREVINELISAGFSVEDISRAVGLSQTEVQLILGLKKKRS
ncbi:MAG: hypothetical protein ABH870_03590 [bacterium]